MGADLVGFASARSFVLAPKGHRPEEILPGARSVIVMAVAIPAASFEKAPSREYSIAYLMANASLNKMAFMVTKSLESQGFRAAAVPASPPYDVRRMLGDISHRHAGMLSGMGVFGKNSLLLSPKYGPRIRLVSVVTDATLLPSKVLQVDLCGDCDRCIRACPAKALKPGMVVDKKKCDNHHLRVGELLQLKDSEQVCGVCIRVCPVGKPKLVDRNQ